MYPMYSYVENFSLHKDDIEGIQYLYGEVTISTTNFIMQTCIKMFKPNFSQPSFQDAKQTLDPTPLSLTPPLPPTQTLMRLNQPPLPPHGLWIQPKMPANWVNSTPSLWLRKNCISSKTGEQISPPLLCNRSKNANINKNVLIICTAQQKLLEDAQQEWWRCQGTIFDFWEVASSASSHWHCFWRPADQEIVLLLR